MITHENHSIDLDIEYWQITSDMELEFHGSTKDESERQSILIPGLSIKSISIIGSHQITICTKGGGILFLTHLCDTSEADCQQLLNQVNMLIHGNEVDATGILLLQGTKRSREFYGSLVAGIASKVVSVAKDVVNDYARIHEGDSSHNQERAGCNNPEEILTEIDAMVGLHQVKREVRSLVNRLRINEHRKREGLRVSGITNHMVFVGGPGTGKTTMARKIASIYNSLGLLSKGHMIEADRSSMVGGFLGQTAIKTTDLLNRAKGGVLFIDEAYTLKPASTNADEDMYGQEAIDTLLKFMEDNRDDLIVIVAGYEHLMEVFLDSNPGIRSRFNKVLHFQDYTAPELLMIFNELAESSHFTTNNAQDAALRLFEEIVTSKNQSFGNGRAVRNIFEKCIASQADRLASFSNPSRQQLQEITPEDIDSVYLK